MIIFGLCLNKLQLDEIGAYVGTILGDVHGPLGT